MEAGVAYGHSRSRTTSSNIFPAPQAIQQLTMQQYPAQQQHHPPQHYARQHPAQQQQPQQQQQYVAQGQQPAQYAQQQGANPQQWRRSPSMSTSFSTASTYQQQPPAAYRDSTSTTDLRRSTSSRSVGTMSPSNSYVALLRKQKATVWCERAQYEDPHTLAQQRAAKMRANLEVVGGYGANGRTRTGLSATGKVAAKIRHGKTPTVGFGYVPGETHVGVGGVPRRLLEDEDQDSDEDDGPYMQNRTQHNRATSSGRSSLTSAQHRGSYRNSSGTGASPLPRRNSSNVNTPDRTDSLPKESPPVLNNDAASAVSGRAPSSGSGASSTERRDGVPELGKAPGTVPNSTLNASLGREKSFKTADELKRRGSVDERSGTLTSGRLFIANPDLD